MSEELHSLLDAVNCLITNDDAVEFFNALTAILPNARAFDARFTGTRAVLNPLVDLAVSDSEKFASVLDLIETKRAASGKPRLQQNTQPGYDKTDYMRDFMQQKRDRERRAVEIENLMRKPTEQLSGRARLDFMQVQSGKWKAGRDAALAAAREHAGGKRLTKPQMQSVIAAFWAKVDKELDDLEELARHQVVTPINQRKRK